MTETTTIEQGVTYIPAQSENDILEKAIQATRQTPREQAKELLRALVGQAMDGTVTWKKNLTASVQSAIAEIDKAISVQLQSIMHQESFKQLEGSWRGMHHVISQSQTNTNLKIRLLSLTKVDLYKDMDKAVEFDQSQIFKKIYEAEFGMPGGQPYGMLLGDYAFSNHPEDIDLLRHMSHVAAAAFCPFVSAADPALLGFDNWRDLAAPRDLEKIFDSVEYAKWRRFRESEDARFVTLTLPRVLARLPYGQETARVDAFNYEETYDAAADETGQMDESDYCWMNASYCLATRMTAAYSEYGWTTAIRGAEGGGKVENLPLHTFYSDDGDIDAQCPTEIGITDRREAELSKLGFLPICHYKDTDYAVFFGAQTTQKPAKYDTPEATANAAISARLPYIMATSRFAHYLKVMARDKIGSFMEVSDCENWLNRWIKTYVNANAGAKQDLKARYPLADAKISVTEVAGQPGTYNAVAWLQPWLQLEALTTSLRLVARIPKLGS